MTIKKTAFAKSIVTQLEDGAIVAIGDCGVMLRLSETETYSNLHELTGGKLVPQYTALLDCALEFAQAFKPSAAFNKDLVAHAFLRQLVADIGEENFAEVVRKQKETPIAGVCYSHDYCDANMTMDAAMASVGIIALPEDEEGMPDRVVDLWNASWDHAKTSMEAMTL